MQKFRWLSLLALLPSLAFAEFSIGTKAGTLGVGIEGMYHFDDQFTVRATLGAYTYSGTREVSDINYDYDLDFSGGGLLLDIFPKGKRFYFTGGIWINANVFNATAVIDQSLTIGRTTYTAAQLGDFSGEVDFEPISPYIGLGWRWRQNQPGFSLGLEAGLLFQGQGDVDLIATGPIADNAQFQSDVVREIDELEDKLGIAKLFPVFEARVAYRF